MHREKNLPRDTWITLLLLKINVPLLMTMEDHHMIIDRLLMIHIAMAYTLLHPVLLMR
jgi:hypothetical protein